MGTTPDLSDIFYNGSDIWVAILFNGSDIEVVILYNSSDIGVAILYNGSDTGDVILKLCPVILLSEFHCSKNSRRINVCPRGLSNKHMCYFVIPLINFHFHW